MKQILILGAGRSASSLIHYLLKHASTENWHIAIGDYDPSFARSMVEGYSNTEVFSFDVFNDDAKNERVQGADLVISLLPAQFHIKVAKACLMYSKPLFTASYLSEEFDAIKADVEKAGLLFLMECGLDPGIDHMTAMQAIHKIQAEGGELVSFKSYAGGLLAPASEDNPWRYKFTWNPRNVVLAGKGTAQFIRDGKYKYIPYHHLFNRLELLDIPGYGAFEAYPNRDSLRYRKVYNLEGIPTMLRGTMRRPGFSEAWSLLVRLGLTEEGYTLEDAEKMTYREFTNSYLAFNPHKPVEDKFCEFFGVSKTSEAFQKIEWLGVFEDTPIGLTDPTPAQVFQQLLEKRWEFTEADRDMIVMHHQFGYRKEGKAYLMKASLVSLGEDHVHTAMSNTVGWPLAIAVKKYLQGKFDRTGVVRPVTPDIYGPVLEELTQMGIELTEEILDWQE